LHLTVDHVGGESLHCQVGLVLPEVAGRVCHEIVGPSGVLDAVQGIVVFDSAQTLLQNSRVQQGVQGVLGDR